MLMVHFNAPLPKDHYVDEEWGGTATVAPPTATTTTAPTAAAAIHRRRRRQQRGKALEQQLPIVEQEVGLLELAPLVLDGGARVHPVVNFNQSLAPLLLRYLQIK
jgi:hypothetical protein